jgi:carbonic anhydrase
MIRSTILAMASLGCALASAQTPSHAPADAHSPATHAAPGAPAPHGGKPHWGYTGKTDARHWGRLSPDYLMCQRGQQQSPIDIRASGKGRLPPLRIDYPEGPAEVLNNGHTVQVLPAPGGRLGLVDGDFELLQFHFHAPGEERVRGSAFPLDVHFVHRNSQGELAVVAVLFKLGQPNPVLGQIFANLPRHADEQTRLARPLDPSGLLPRNRAYYAYMGSLTTPPCSENVRWQVLKTTMTLSRAQLDAFRRLYSMNARPVQPTNRRPIDSGG